MSVPQIPANQSGSGSVVIAIGMPGGKGGPMKTRSSRPKLFALLLAVALIAAACGSNDRDGIADDGTSTTDLPGSTTAGPLGTSTTPASPATTESTEVTSTTVPNAGSTTSTAASSTTATSTPGASSTTTNASSPSSTTTTSPPTTSTSTSSTTTSSTTSTTLAPTTHQVSIGDEDQCEGKPSPCVGFFNPLAFTISAGDTVRWTNRGTIGHTTTSGTGGSFPGARDGIWDSGNLGLGQSFSQTFDSPGTFSVFCTLHPILMGTATVVVEG